jgi:hypothetical protein
MWAESMLVAQRMAGRNAGTVEPVKARTPEEVAAVSERLREERRRFVLQVATDEATAGMARYLGVDAGA